MIQLAWAAVVLIAIVAIYDAATKAIDAWRPKTPTPNLSTGQMIDNTLFAAQLRDLKNDVNALKIQAGFRKAMGEKTEAK